MPADVMKRLYFAGLVAQDNDAVPSAKLEHEVVARVPNAIVMIDHEPEVLAEMLLVLGVDCIIDVVFDGNGLPFRPSICIATRHLPGRPERTLRCNVVTIVALASVRHLRRQYEAPTLGNARPSRLDAS